MPQDNKKKQSESPKFTWDQVMSMMGGILNAAPQVGPPNFTSAAGSSYGTPEHYQEYKALLGPEYSYQNVEMPYGNFLGMAAQRQFDKIAKSRGRLFADTPSLDGPMAMSPEIGRDIMRYAAMQKLGSLERAGRPQYLRPEDQQY